MEPHTNSEVNNRLDEGHPLVGGESVNSAEMEDITEMSLQLKRAQNRGMAAHLLEIGLDCAPRLGQIPSHADLLYGVDGLPK
jgi:hypothetical protein